MNIKKSAALLLSTLLAVQAIAACGGTSGENKTTDDSKSAAADSETTLDGALDTAADTETDRSQIKDTLPDDLDFSGLEIRFIHRDDGHSLAVEIKLDEDSGDVVDTAIYNRTVTVEERLNVSIGEITVANTIHDGGLATEAVRKSVLAGSDDYDIIANHMSQTTPLIAEGALCNLSTLPYLDFDQPWWAKSFMDAASVGGKCYQMAGDIGLTMIQSMYLVYYNKAMYADYFTGDLYDSVMNGEWTVDKMHELSSAVYSDLDGNGEANRGDRFGLTINLIRLLDAFLVGCDVPLTERDSDGIPYFAVENERTYSFIEKVHDLLYDKTATVHTTASADGETELLSDFAAGKSLFIVYTPLGTDSLRDMDDDFSVIPMPKLDESQSDYTTCVHNGFSAFGIVSTCKNTDAAAALCEALCAQSYRTVTPAYYETALKLKYSRDDETSRMLDMIRDSISFDFGYINNQSLDGVMAQFRDLLKLDSGKAASTLASKMTKSQAKLDALLQTYAELP